MEYLVLAVSVLFFSIQYIFLKMYESNVDGKLLSNLWLLCIYGLSLAAIFWVVNGFSLAVTTASVLYAVQFSVWSIACSLGSVCAMKLGKMSTVTMFTLMGGLIIPVMYGIAFLGERLTWGKAAGLIAITVSFFYKSFTGGKSDSTAQRASYKFLLLCVVTFLGNGFISVVVKAHQISENPVPEIDFLVITSFVTFVISLLLILFLVCRKGLEPQDTAPEVMNKQVRATRAFFSGIGKSFSSSVLLFMLLIAVLYSVTNGIGNILSMNAARTLDSSIQFPIISGGVLTLTAIFSWLFFKEKLSKCDNISIVLAITGIVLFRY